MMLKTWSPLLSSKSGFRPSLTLKAFGTALALMACEPFNPLGTCEMPPDCGQKEYRLSARTGNYPFTSEHTTFIDSLPLLIGFYEASPIQATSQGGAGGRAYALSCIGCSGYLESVSVVFSTDVVTLGGDTLKSGHDFALMDDRAVKIDSLRGFRDSMFEVRFSGKIDGQWKYDTLTLTLRNPALFLPR